MHHYSGKKAFKTTVHGMATKRFYETPVCIAKSLQQISIRLLYIIFYILAIYYFINVFFFAVNHQQTFKGSYHRINNNITSQNKAKHALHSNGSNNNNNNNNTSHSPSSKPNTVKRKKHCTMQRGTGDCVR